MSVEAGETTVVAGMSDDGFGMAPTGDGVCFFRTDPFTPAHVRCTHRGEKSAGRDRWKAARRTSLTVHSVAGGNAAGAAGEGHGIQQAYTPFDSSAFVVPELVEFP